MEISLNLQNMLNVLKLQLEEFLEMSRNDIKFVSEILYCLRKKY